MFLLELLPEPYFRFAVLISFTVAFGGFGFLFIVSFFENSLRRPAAAEIPRALALGISLATLCVCGLNIFGVPLTGNTLSIAILGTGGIAALRLFRKKAETRARRSFSRAHGRTESLILISLFFLLLLLRVVQIRDVVVPSWYDGILHTSLLQELARLQAMPFDQLGQTGFYALGLVIHSFWKLSFPETVLLTGQWLSVVAGISFYGFARRYIRDPYAAGFSLVAYSFALLFPAQLNAWGHYPYLLGLALLPPAIGTSQDWMEGRKNSFPELAVLLTSLAFIDFGLLLIWLSFLLVYGMNRMFFKEEFRLRIPGSRQQPLLILFTLILPASLALLSRRFDPLPPEIVHNPLLSPFYQADFGLGRQYLFRLFRTHDSVLIAFWAVGICWSLVWNRRFLYLTLFWPLACWLMVWIQLQFLPQPVLSYENLIVFLSIPLALSLGLLAKQLFLLLLKLEGPGTLPTLRRRMKTRSSILIAIAMLAGLCTSPLSFDPKTALFEREDLLAMRWIDDHTAPDAGFLIRSVNWRDDILIPSDGGGWIPFLTGLRAVIPQTGELYDICQFAAGHGVQYLYFGKERGNDPFDIRLSDPEIKTYVLVYGSPSVEIVSLDCPALSS